MSMSISNIGSAGTIQGGYSGDETQSIDQKIKQLQMQLEKVKSNDKLSKEEKDKRVKNLQDQIKHLEEKKAKLKQKEGNDVLEPENAEAQHQGVEEKNSLNQLD